RRHTRCYRDWSSDVCSSDLTLRTSHNPAHISYGSACLNHLHQLEVQLRRGVQPQWLHKLETHLMYPWGRCWAHSTWREHPAADRSEERRVGKRVDLGCRRTS